MLSTGSTLAQTPPVQGMGSSSVSSTAVSDASATVAEIGKLIGQGKDAAALDSIQRLGSSRRSLAGLDRLQGDAFYDLNRLPEANEAYRRALAADPHDQAAAQMRGLTLFKLGRPADAIPLLEQDHTFGPQIKADPTYVLALCYLDTLKYDDARHAFAAQYGMAPDSAPAYLLTARMLLRRGYLPIAQQYAEKAVSLDARLPLAHELLGEIALAQNHNEVAIRELETERATDPLQGAVYERLGDAYSRATRYIDAIRVLQQAVLLEPNATGPYILLGKVMLRQAQPLGAVTYLEKAEAMDPANFMTHNYLAQAYRGLGRTEDAHRELALTEKVQATAAPKLGTPQ